MDSSEHSRMFERGQSPPKQEGKSDAAPQWVEKVAQLSMTHKEREGCRELNIA